MRMGKLVLEKKFEEEIVLDLPDGREMVIRQEERQRISFQGPRDVGIHRRPRTDGRQEREAA